MKKFVRVLLILAACLACLGVVLTAVGGFWSARVYNRLIPEEAVSISFPLNADTLSSLTLNVGVGEVRFAEAPSPEAARIDTEGFSEGDFTFSENRQGEVVLCSRSMLGGESIFNLGFLRMDWLGRLHTGTLARRIVTVYLPAGQLDRLRIEGGTGDIGGTLPVSARELSISCGTGNVKLSGLRADDISIEAGMGNITLDQLICKKLTVSGGTGGLTLRDGEASESAVFELGTGTTQLHRVALHKLDLSAGVGSLSLSGTLRGDCEIELGVGSSDIHLLEPSAHYSAEIERGLGNLSVSGANVLRLDDETEAISPDGDADCQLKIQMGMGSLALSFDP